MRKIELINYKMLTLAAFILIVGYILLYQPHQDHADVFNYEIFSSRSLVVSPIVLTVGYSLVVVSIMLPVKKAEK